MHGLHNERLTRGLDCDMGIREVLCPRCQRLQFKYKPTRDTWIERKCKCKSLFRVIGYEIREVTV